MQKKILNDAVAYIRGLAEQRGRNADWAEQAVREGVNLTASEALAQNVIDLVAADVPALLAALDGRSVRTSAGELRLETAGLVVREIEPDWRFRLLSVLASPTIAYVLLLVGVYGLLLEGYNPGAILPGVVGAISLLFALFALQVLPVNYVGLALMALGLALLVTEALVPSFGVLGFGGIVAFVFGSVLLMDTDVPGYGVNLGLIAGLAIGASLLMALTLYLLARSRRQPVVTGDALQIGQTVVVRSFADGQGVARLGGEIWRIRSSAALTPGSRARVVAIDGLVLQVEPLA
jgi:membrane-bound serine protease (ClpP class)